MTLALYPKKRILTLVLFMAVIFVQAQHKVIKGYVKDAQSDERIPFASLLLVKSGIGKLSDSAGAFSFQFNSWPKDTLSVTYVGYKDYKILLRSLEIANKDTLDLVIPLDRGKYATEVIVKKRVDRGLLLWKKIVRRKSYNDRFRFNNFSYELYNKLELDLDRFKFKKLEKFNLFRPFKDVIEQHVDTSGGPPFLPVYLTESMSDFYYQKSPHLTREVIKASKTIGFNNESVRRLLGGTNQVVNVYNNFIPVFDKQFVSPISDNGDFYYRYRVVDTQYVNAQRLFHLVFYQKRKGENTFEGDCWVHDTTFAIQKMTLYLSKDANINFVDKLSLIQEYIMLPDTTWTISKDKFVVNASPMGQITGGAIGRKTTTYRHFVYDDSAVVNELKKNKQQEEIVFLEKTGEKSEEYWQGARHEGLTKSEQSIYHMIDTLQTMPAFKKFTNKIYFFVVGFKNIGNYEIGPFYSWVTYNVHEGLRLRFDLGTNRFFSKKIYLHAYLAYGLRDMAFKYKMEGLYLFNKNPRTHLLLSYLKDMDFGQNYYDQVSQDNVFALAARKSGVPLKFLMIDEKKAEFMHESRTGLAATVTAIHKTFDPLVNLPPKSTFENGNGHVPFSTSEISLRIRYAHLEQFLISTFNRISLGSDYPIIEAKFTRGIRGLFKSSYDYTKLSASISDDIKVAPFGNIYYSFFAGKTFGKLPYMLLDVAPGNEIYYYNRYAFNLMNRYEFLHDRYGGVNFEHNIGSGIFRYIPLVRKLKLRQFYSARALMGSLSQVNKQYNMPPGSAYTFESLNGRSYLELGTGVDNILKLFRLDFVWRLAPRPLPIEPAKRFGIFGSFRVAF